MVADDDSTELAAHNRLAEGVVYVTHVKPASETLGGDNGPTLVRNRLRSAA